MTFEEAHEKDLKLARENLWLGGLPPLAPCRCGGTTHADVSMALIYCEKCGLSFEYRYDRGILPYYTWQLNAGVQLNDGK